MKLAAIVRSCILPVVLIPGFATFSAQTTPSKDAARRASAASAWMQMPLAFEPAADGQSLVARLGGNAVHIDASGAATFYGGSHSTGDNLPASVTLQLAGANRAAAVSGTKLLPGSTNYLLGQDPSRWRQHVQRFGEARVNGVYPGIDLLYYGNGSQLEHDYVVGAGADPAAIRMEFSAGTPTLGADGALVLLEAQHGTELLRLRPPVAYQDLAAGRTPVSAAYIRHRDGTFGFVLGKYDATAPLVIDPVITYSTYFGGSNLDSVVGMQIDAAGNIYLLLSTQSIDMKTAGGPTGVCNGTCGVNNPNPTLAQQIDPDFFIAKFNPAGNTLIFGTYIGGSSQDQPQTLAVDSTGAIYAWGTTTSTDFPTKNAYQATPPAGLSYSNYVFAGVLLKLSADGSQLLYSTYFGAAAASLESAGGYAAPDELALAGNGIAYVAGFTGDQSGQTFSSPKNALFTGGEDFVAKFDTTQTGAASLLYATPVGPPSTQNSAYNAVTVAGLAVDSKSNLWISGVTYNSGFPTATTHAVQSACGTPSQCTSPYLMELDPTGQSVLYATFFGGTTNTYGGPAFDYATGLAIDSQDNIYWAGRTEDADFPVKNQAYTVTDVGPTGWVAEFAAGGYPVLYSSYAPCWPRSVGGFLTASDSMLSFTCSQDNTSLPLKNSISSGHASGYNYDAYFGVFDTAKSGANSILTESYLGSSSGVTSPNKTVFDSHGNLWLGGATSATNLPLMNPYQSACDMCQPSEGPVSDGFVTRIAMVQISPASLTFPLTNVGSTSATMTATITNLYGAAVTLGIGSLTDSADFSATDNCGGTVAAFGSCIVTFSFKPKSAGSLASTYSITASDATGTLLATLSATLSGTGNGVPLPLFAPSSLVYTTTAGTQAANQTTTLTNSGSLALNINYISLSGANASSFSIVSNNCGNTLAVNASCNVVVGFTTTTTGTYTAMLVAYDNASPTTQSVALSGTVTAPAPIATFSPGSLTFTTVAGTQAYNQTTTLTNSGITTLNISSMVIGGTNASSFTIVSNTCGLTLAPSSSCTVTIGFTAITAGTYTAALTATDNAAPTTQTVQLNGQVNGIPQATVFPTSLSFSATAGTTSAAQTVTLSNSGSAALTIQSLVISGANPTDFAQTNNCGATLAAGSLCTVNVTFTAATAGSYTAALIFTDNSGLNPSSQQVTLAGTAASAVPADYTVTATPSTQTAAGGTTVTYTIQLTSLLATNPFTSAVTLSVSGLPAGATASFNPVTVTPGTQGANSTLSITVPAHSASSHDRPSMPLGRGALGTMLAFMLVSFFGRGRRRQSRLLNRLAVAALLLASATLSGCGSGAAASTTTSTLVITGTAGATTHSTNVTLIVR